MKKHSNFNAFFLTKCVSLSNGIFVFIYTDIYLWYITVFLLKYKYYEFYHYCCIINHQEIIQVYLLIESTFSLEYIVCHQKAFK